MDPPASTKTTAKTRSAGTAPTTGTACASARRSGVGARGRSKRSATRRRLPRESASQVRSDLWPLVVDDAVVSRVAAAVAVHDHVLAEDALEPRRERRESGPGPLVTRVGLELDAHATEVTEGVLEHQQLGLDVRACPPVGRGEPGPADLQATVRRPEGEIAGAADGFAALGVQGRERGLVPLLRSREGGFDPGAKGVSGLRRVVGTARVERHVPPDPRVLGDPEEILFVAWLQRLEDDQRTFEPARDVLPHASLPTLTVLGRLGVGAVAAVAAVGADELATQPVHLRAA